MIKGFEDFDSTKVGRMAEKIVREYYIRVLDGYHVVEDIDEEYNTARDLVLSKDFKRISLEIKGDNYKQNVYTDNLPFEFQQENLSGEMVDSGIRKTKADLIPIYCFRHDTIYVTKLSTLNQLLSIGSIGKGDAKLCNIDSRTGKTMCYMVSISYFEQGECFEAIYTNAYKILQESGFCC